MRTAGIVRRVDDLGCFIIPKKVRRELGICVGDLMEILIDKDGSIILKKYDMPICSNCDKPLGD